MDSDKNEQCVCVMDIQCIQIKACPVLQTFSGNKQKRTVAYEYSLYRKRTIGHEYLIAANRNTLCLTIEYK